MAAESLRLWDGKTCLFSAEAVRAVGNYTESGNNLQQGHPFYDIFAGVLSPWNDCMELSQTATKMNQHVSYLVGHNPSHWLPLSWTPENNCSRTWTLDCLVQDHLPEGWGTLLDSNDGQRTRTSIWDHYLASHNQLGHWNMTQICSWNILN